ncbi:MAG: electron transfer flavoprotein subunit alpha/FixB family protein [Candidatus Dormibacteria bacterium]
MGAGSVWVLTASHEEFAQSARLEPFTWARRLGRPVEALTVGRPTPELRRLLGDHGVAAIHAIGNREGDSGLSAAAIAAVIARGAAHRRPAVIVMAAGRDGRDIAGRLGVRLGSAVVGGVDAAMVGDGSTAPRLTLHSTVLGGSLRVGTAIELGPPAVVLLRPGSCRAAPLPIGTPPVTSLAAALEPEAGRVTILSHAPQSPAGRPLEEATMVVSGGAGLGPDGFQLLRRVADVLGAAVGASRPAIDAGWAPPSALVGQSGTTVAPDVYLACGISGAPQHVSAIRSAGCVIAVNRDPDAPIFRIADLGIVGDAAAVLDKLLSELLHNRPPIAGETAHDGGAVMDGDA